MVPYRPMLPQRATSGSMLIMWPCTGAYATTGGHTYVRGQYCSLKPWWWSQAMLLSGAALMWVACPTTWGRGDIWPMLQLRAVSRSVILLYLGSVLMSVTWIHSDVHDLSCNKGSCLGPWPYCNREPYLWSVLTPETIWKTGIHTSMDCGEQLSYFDNEIDGWRYTAEKEGHGRLPWQPLPPVHPLQE